MSSVIGPKFMVKGIEPPAVRMASNTARRVFWQAVAGFVIEAKDLELRQGLDKDGNPMAALAKRTIENRHSDMGPADPNAPPLQPAHGLSRTRSLFTVEPTNAANGLNCWWQYDELTGASWGEILEKHAEGGDHLPVRDVIGLSPMSIEVVRRRAAAWWRAFEVGIETRVEPQRETLPTPAPRFSVEDVKRYQPKTFERPTTGKVTHSIRINKHTYTLQTGSRAQTKRMISSGTYSGPGRVTPLPGGGPEAFASRVPAGTKGLEWLKRSETATPIFVPTPMTDSPLINQFLEITNAAKVPVVIFKDLAEAQKRWKWLIDVLPAAYDYKKNVITLNPHALHWKDPSVFSESVEPGFFSGTGVAHAAHHETGHYLHAQEITPKVFEKWVDIKPAQIKLIRDEVSGYAAENRVEFVAEVYAGLKSGLRYSRPIMALYRRYKGPDHE